LCKVYDINNIPVKLNILVKTNNCVQVFTIKISIPFKYKLILFKSDTHLSLKYYLSPIIIII